MKPPAWHTLLKSKKCPCGQEVGMDGTKYWILTQFVSLFNILWCLLVCNLDELLAFPLCTVSCHWQVVFFYYIFSGCLSKKKGPNQTLQIIQILCVLCQQTLNVRSMFSSNNKKVYLTKKTTGIEQKKFLHAISILYIILVLSVPK